jgi:hypothetical protein
MLLAQISKEPDKADDSNQLEQLERRVVEKVESRITDAIEAETISAMENQREGMQSLIAPSVEAQLEAHLASLLKGIEVEERSAGPGRGHKGSHVSKLEPPM